MYNTFGKQDISNMRYIMDKIIVKGARENNLKNIDIEIPKK